MYKLLRNFSIVAFISLALAIPVHSWLHYNNEAEAQRAMGVQKNIALSHILRNTLAHVYTPLLGAENLDREQRDLLTDAFAREVQKQLEGSAIVRLELHGRDGKTVFSATAAGMEQDRKDERIGAALQGEIVSRTVTEAETEGFEPGARIVETYVPVGTDPDGRPRGVLELYTDISAEMRRVSAEVAKIAWVDAGILAFLCCVLFFIVRHGDRIIGEQSEQHIHDVHRLEETKEAAEKVDRTKTRFIANVSHEIRTPMSAVIGFTDLLLRGDLDAKQRGQIQSIARAGQLVLGVMDDILEFSKIDSGQLRFEQTNFVADDVLRNVLEIVSNEAASKGLRLRTEIATGAVPILGDSFRLRQILLNLIGNAIKFSESGDVMVRLHTLKEDDARIEIYFAIQDSGIGIAPEDQVRLFKPFSQVSFSSAGRYGGSGLGLAICKHLAEAMGGQIGVESRLGEGSTFWFSLPFKKQPRVQGFLQEAAGEGGSQRERRKSPRPRAGQHDRPRVLIVEDNLVTRAMLVEMVVELRYRVDAVADGKAALALLEQTSFDILLLDCQMPNIDGYQVTTELRRRQLHTERTPIIALTADATADARQRCIAAGMDDYLSKPVRLGELAKTLESWLPGQSQPTATHELSNFSQAGNGGSLDPEVWNELRQRGQDAQFSLDRYIELFVSDSEARLMRIARHLENENAQQVACEAHALKGACRQLGVSAMAQYCAELSTNTSVTEQRVFFKKLQEEFGRVRKEMVAERDRISRAQVVTVAS